MNQYINSRTLLWIDGSAGALVGISMLVLAPWLQGLFQLPSNIYYLIAAANVIYGCYSLTLSALPRRPKALILLLVGANATWSVVCIYLLSQLFGQAGWLGLGHIFLEGLFVAGLAALEWRWREELLQR